MINKSHKNNLTELKSNLRNNKSSGRKYRDNEPEKSLFKQTHSASYVIDQNVNTFLETFVIVKIGYITDANLSINVNFLFLLMVLLKSLYNSFYFIIKIY